MEVLFITIITVLAVFYAFQSRRKRLKSPPGPMKIPLFGSLPFISIKKGISDWALDHSVTQLKIATVHKGPFTEFVINDFDLAKQLFNKEEFSGRNATNFQLLHRFFNQTPQGISFTQDDQWSTQRRFSLKTLKDFGFGKISLEDSIRFEVEELTEHFLTFEGDHLIANDFSIPIINILWQMVAEYRFAPEDLAGWKMVENVSTIFNTGFKVDVFPMFINKMFPTWTSYGKRSKASEGILYYLKEIVEKHDAELDPNNPRDFIGVYLNEIRKQPEGQEFNKNDLVGCIYDFFVAGTETSATTLKWLVLYFTLHQDVQQRCRNEIISVLGSRKASVSDMTSLPYIQATISEIQRVSRVAPFSLPHLTTQATVVGQFTFPKQSVFSTNISFIMNDPDHFNSPHTFNPSRFINLEGRFIKNERVIPFGIGKRYCMGEILARNQIFIFLVTMLQKLKFDLPLHHKTPDPLNYIVNLSRIPDDFHVQIGKV